MEDRAHQTDDDISKIKDYIWNNKKVSEDYV